MPQIVIEQFDVNRHPNPMRWVDDSQRQRHQRSPNLVPYSVCLVIVKKFTFIFHSVEQIHVCVDYYRREHHPSSRLPVYTENLGGDHWETQRWFDRLPQQLLDKKNRPAVVKALEQAILEYSKVPGAVTGAAVQPYNRTW